eukprot:Lankesteria_metandrocarpae@DN4720_c0_g1_i1.p1
MLYDTVNHNYVGVTKRDASTVSFNGHRPIAAKRLSVAATRTATGEERGVLAKKSIFYMSRGRLADAVSVCDRALETLPEDIFFLNSKASCLHRMGDFSQALESAAKALSAQPNDIEARINAGIAHICLGTPNKGATELSHALTLDSDNENIKQLLASALVDAAVSLKNQGLSKQAAEKCFEAMLVDSKTAQAHYLLGLHFSDSGNLQLSARFYSEAIRLSPDYIEALTNLGGVCKSLGQLDEAVRHFKVAYRLMPNFVPIAKNLAMTLTEIGTEKKNMGNLKEAKHYYRSALSYDSTFANAFYNLGVVYGEEGKFEKALVSYKLAINFNEHFAEAYNNIGLLYKQRDNLELALSCCMKALELKPMFAHALNNIAVMYTLSGQMSEAYKYTKRAIEVLPTYSEASNNLGVLYRDEGEVELALRAYDASISMDPNSRNAKQNRLLILNYFSGLGADYIHGEAVKWGRECIEQIKPYSDWKVTKEPVAVHRKLRIGYLSADFYVHSVSYFIQAPLDFYNPHRFEIYVYANVQKEDFKTELLKSRIPTNRWRNLVGVSEAMIAQVIREDRIDILVELGGHTANNLLEVMAHRPAPIQVSWIGYPNTTGLPTIDYRFTDVIADRPHRISAATPTSVTAPPVAQCVMSTATAMSSSSLKCVSSDTNAAAATTSGRPPIHQILSGNDINSRGVFRSNSMNKLLFTTNGRNNDLAGPSTILTSAKSDHEKYPASKATSKCVCHQHENNSSGSCMSLPYHAGAPSSINTAAPLPSGVHEVKLTAASGSSTRGGDKCSAVTDSTAPASSTLCCAHRTASKTNHAYRRKMELFKEEQPYTETLVRLPGPCFLCYTPAVHSPSVTPSPHMLYNCITFGSFNNLAKVRQEVVDLWCEILNAVPNSRLMIKAKPLSSADLQAKWVAAFTSRGVAAERLDFVGLISGYAEHLQAYSLVDVCLDTFPYAGTTTTCEALYMGVPVVTLKGNYCHAHNVGVSLLCAVGLTELVAGSKEEYCKIACDLALNGTRLELYRETIRCQMLSSPLCDGPTFVEGLEHTYMELFNMWVDGVSPAEENVAAMSRMPHSSPVLSGRGQRATTCFDTTWWQ